MTSFYGAGNIAFELPELLATSSYPYGFSGLQVNASGTKRAFCGPVQWVDRGTHDIRYVWWRTGATVTAGTGSTFRISLQDVSATALAPDNGVDQSFTIATGSLAANTLYKHQMDADRSSVAHGSLLSVVYDFSVFGSGSSIGIARLQRNRFLAESAFAVTTNGGTTWGNSNLESIPVLILESSDGAIGTIHGAVPFKAFNTHTFNSGSDPKEYAMEFVPDTGWTVAGMQPLVGPASLDADFEAVLYADTTAALTQAHDATFIQGAATLWFPRVSASSVDLTAATTYRAAVKPTTTNNVSVYSIDVDQASHWDLVSMGQDVKYNTKSAADAWGTATATRRLVMNLLVTGGDTGGGATGAYMEHGRFDGGF